jgi:glycosyltransferase involved in cell wall biosynthesis
VIVVDDGSSDDPGAVVRAFADVRLIRQDNRGLAAARNAGLSELTAD